MTDLDLIRKYKKYLAENFDKNRAVKEKAYLYSKLKHYGLKSSLMGQFFKENREYVRGVGKKEMLGLVNNFWKEGSFEERMMGLDILVFRKDILELSDMLLIEKLMRECEGWALLDNLIIPIMPSLLSKYKKSWRYLEKWIKDDDFWVRRSAILAQLMFFRNGDGGNKRLFFRFCESHFNESWIDKIYISALERKRARFFIRKAIGWSLREMSIKDSKSVLMFVKKNKDQMSGLTLREATRKLSKKILATF